jgi:hypothetical protein
MNSPHCGSIGTGAKKAPDVFNSLLDWAWGEPALFRRTPELKMPDESIF